MEIELCGYKVLIDDEDYERVISLKWCKGTTRPYKPDNIYFLHSYKDENKKTHSIILHRYIIGLKLHDGVFCDHANGNTLDNRKSNLRKCTIAENNRNQRLSRINKTGYKGVSSLRGGSRYRAVIRYNKRLIHLGYYKTAEEAYKAYCEASKKYHGEYGCVK
jgi:hypothetical protein